MKINPVTTLVGLVLISGVVVTAYATLPQAVPNPEFSALDRNGDARLSPREAAVIAGLATHFPNLDRDGNGVLDREEFSRSGGRPASEG